MRCSPSYLAIASLSKIAVSTQKHTHTHTHTHTHRYIHTVWFWLQRVQQETVCITCFSCGQASGREGAGLSRLADVVPALKPTTHTHTDTHTHTHTLLHKHRHTHTCPPFKTFLLFMPASEFFIILQPPNESVCVCVRVCTCRHLCVCVCVCVWCRLNYSTWISEKHTPCEISLFRNWLIC